MDWSPNDLEHTAHLNGFSPVWIRSCRTNDCLWVKAKIRDKATLWSVPTWVARLQAQTNKKSSETQKFYLKRKAHGFSQYVYNSVTSFITTIKSKINF